MSENVKIDHVRLFIPGPVEVRQEILEAQTEWMIGHRSKAFADLFARIQPKLKQSFRTENRVYIFTSSGTGIWEAASRNVVRDDKKILHLVCGAFSERWSYTSKVNGKQVDVLEVDYGQAITADMLADALAKETYDAVACVYNETSTGVLNPVSQYAEVMENYPDTLFLVDTVSAYVGAPLHVDEWGIDLCLTSTQKAFALPPGMAFGTISEAVLARAAEVPYRGYYFDLLEMEKSYQKNNTPATPPISLMFAADKQLDDILAEGLEAREARHQQMAQRTREWGLAHGFKIFPQAGFESPTLTVLENTLELDIKDLNAFLKTRGMEVANGYGKIKDKTIRIAHMGDCMPEHLDVLLAAMEDYLTQR